MFYSHPSRPASGLHTFQPGAADTPGQDGSRPGMCRLCDARLDKGSRSTVGREVAPPSAATVGNIAARVLAEGTLYTLPLAPEYERDRESQPANRHRWRLLRPAARGAAQERRFLKAASTCDKQLP